MLPIVSVVMPLFESEQYMRESIEGVLRQSVRDLELILVEDSSQDATGVVAKEYLVSDSRVTLISFDTNKGAGVARNAGIDAARGRYIAFCDSDDVWEPHKLRVQLSAMESERAAISHTSYFRCDEPLNNVLSIVPAPSRVDFNKMLSKNWIACSTVVIDTSIVGKKLMPPIRRRQDYAYWLTYLRDGHDAIGIGEPLVRYRVRSKSLSSNKLAAAVNHVRVLVTYGTRNPIRIFLGLLTYCYYGLIKNLVSSSRL